MNEEELEKALDDIFKEDMHSIRERMKSLMISYDNALEEQVKQDKVIDLMAERLARFGMVSAEHYKEYFYKKAEKEGNNEQGERGKEAENIY